MKVGLNNPHTKSIVLSTKDFSEHADAEEEDGAKIEHHNAPRSMKRRKMRRRGGKLSQPRNTQPAVTATDVTKKQSIINEEDDNANGGTAGENGA